MSRNELFCAGSSTTWSPVPAIPPGRGRIPAAAAFVVKGASAAARSVGFPSTGFIAARNSEGSGVFPSTTLTFI